MILKCPICNYSGDKFKYYGTIPRKNAMCPSCNSLERKRLLYFILSNELSIFNYIKYKTILHFAPSKGIYQLFNSDSNFKYFPVDINPKDFKFGIINKFDICEDIQNIPDNFYDLIINFHVLEHIKCDYKQILFQFKRILTTTGVLILCVPFKGDYTIDNLDKTHTLKERKTLFGGENHIRMFGRKDFTEVLNNTFECVKQSNIYNSLSVDEINLYNIKNSRVDLCSKNEILIG